MISHRGVFSYLQFGTKTVDGEHTAYQVQLIVFPLADAGFEFFYFSI